MSAAIEARAFHIPRWLKRHETLLAIILIIALVGLGLMNDRFLTLDNLLNQGRLMTEIGLIALPMTFVIITGGIDISVGAIVGFARSCWAIRGRRSAFRCRWRSPSLSSLARSRASSTVSSLRE